ncbi:hypothetical protein M5K25_003589 [Dendrobium thyrsiflorum]|uniref:Uncharacterized protein n=1 Tax=Dendrobium thyrsiflorum TaxID=117978 RepID=A0ABD0VJF3_DENTH
MIWVVVLGVSFANGCSVLVLLGGVGVGRDVSGMSPGIGWDLSGNIGRTHDTCISIDGVKDRVIEFKSKLAYQFITENGYSDAFSKYSESDHLTMRYAMLVASSIDTGGLNVLFLIFLVQKFDHLHIMTLLFATYILNFSK